MPAAARRPEIAQHKDLMYMAEGVAHCLLFAQHKDLMYMAEGVAHCLLFVDSKTGDGLLVEAEGYDYARNSHFVPNAKAILENNEITNEERQLHRTIMAMADRGGEPPLVICLPIRLTAKRSAEIPCCRLCRRHIRQRMSAATRRPCQPDLRVKAKPTREMKFFSPLHIVHEPDVAAYSWDEPISEMDYEELNAAEMLACKDEIKRRTAAGDCCLMHFVQAATDVFQFI